MNPAENWQTAAGPIAAEPEPAPAFAAPTALPIAPPTVSRKNPFLAALLSAFPGMGNVYNGLYMRGLTFFLIIVSLIGITTSGRSPNVVNGLRAARDAGALAVAWTGADPGPAGEAADVVLAVPTTTTARIQEVHTLLMHTICVAVDAWASGG